MKKIIKLLLVVSLIVSVFYVFPICKSYNVAFETLPKIFSVTHNG